MKERKVKHVDFIISGIVVVLIFISFYISDKAPNYGPEGWNTVKVDDIDYVRLVPLLSYGSARLTLQSEIRIDSRDLIDSLFKEMQCTQRASMLAGRWWADKQIKMVYYLKNSDMMSFQLSFHLSKNVVDYYKIPNNEKYDAPKFYADCGSSILYDFLMGIIKTAKIEFVQSSSPVE
jgi:mannosyltransferase OCH1-like enzyme